ncbi:MFS transporter [Streptomyces morookaense]|uniref:MFS transporter n=1 Tax=Streptomyces morookaense TaxID=1970 RepID=A0A7Y7B078_STRMO|nr:MFS transporter [Streptomyces morookaense]NVK76567.1 MFS transporter [Streptomyces morookaense]GHF08023.1 putative actinorhodin transporter [Streptomyces morookaense]
MPDSRTDALARPAPGDPSPALGPPPYRWRWAALWVLLAGETMDMLDSLVAAVAAPSIRADLGGGPGVTQWLGAAYALAMAVGLITGGRLGDVVGRRRAFLLGAAGFTGASLLCAAAMSPGFLIAARGLQGLFGAVMIPQGLGLIKEMFRGRELGRAMGMYGPVMGLSYVGGPVLAGWLVSADWFGAGWRMVFLVNLPLGLLALAGGWRFLPASGPAAAARLDLAGAALASAAALPVVLPLVQGREQGWPIWAFVSMAAGVALFGVFGWYEERVARAGGDPLVMTGLFRKRAFSGGLVTGAALFAAVAGFSLALSLYFQSGLGASPLKAGLAVLPWSAGTVVGFAVVQVLDGRGVLGRFGRPLVQTGVAVMALGSGAFACALRSAGARVTVWQGAPALVVVGVGMGLVTGPFFQTVLAAVEPHETGSAAGTLTAVQQFGSALGSAVLGTVFFSALGGRGAAGELGYARAMEITLGAEAGLLALTLLASFLLPVSGNDVGD